MSFQSEFSAGFSEMLGAFGQTATIAGVSYPVIAQNLSQSDGFGDGGFRPRSTIQLHLQRGSDPAPAKGSDVIFDGKTLRVESVESDEVSYYLSCYDPAKR